MDMDRNMDFATLLAMQREYTEHIHPKETGKAGKWISASVLAALIIGVFLLAFM